MFLIFLAPTGTTGLLWTALSVGVAEYVVHRVVAVLVATRLFAVVDAGLRVDGGMRGAR